MKLNSRSFHAVIKEKENERWFYKYILCILAQDMFLYVQVVYNDLKSVLELNWEAKKKKTEELLQP